MLNNVYHLFARHAELAQDTAFLSWLKANGSAYWYETGFSDPSPRVVIVSADESSAWAALETLEDGDGFPYPKVVKTAELDLTSLPPRESVVRSALAATGSKRNQIVSAKPVVHFGEHGVVTVEWVIEVENSAGAIAFGSSSGLAKSNRTIDRQQTTSDYLRPLVADDMATNEVHSPYLFAAEAQQWTQGPLSIREKASRIANNVSRTYAYDGSISLISEFTWADYLVRDRNGRRGICDEYAVVQISYLRSIGIPARLKFLIWQDAAGTGVGHACLEFNEGSRWVHMDGLWNAFDYPGRYRASGARNLTVMDADYPADSRSSTPAWGKPDATGDGKLYPYGDFIIAPGYPGNSRAGYSY